MRGPIDFIVVGFDGNNFNGEVLSELDKSVDDGVIKVLALALVAKDNDGNVVTVAADDNEAVLEFTDKYSLDSSFVDDEDISEVGEILENNTAAGLLVVEHLWAIGLKQAISDAGGFLITDGRIHPDAAAELED